MSQNGEVIYKTDTCTSVLFEGVNIWDKSLDIYHTTDIQGHNDIMIVDCNFEYRCPKCNIEFNPKPTHGDKIVCRGCGASYEFSGACHPEPTGDTRKEVEKVLGL